MEFSKMPLSAKIKYLRESKGMSQGSLARASGVSVAEICRIEKGERQNPSIFLINRICSSLEVDNNMFLEVVGYNFVREVLEVEKESS